MSDIEQPTTTPAYPPIHQHEEDVIDHDDSFFAANSNDSESTSRGMQLDFREKQPSILPDELELNGEIAKKLPEGRFVDNPKNLNISIYLHIDKQLDPNTKSIVRDKIAEVPKIYFFKRKTIFMI